MPWEVRSRNGIWLPQLDWWLDAHRPAPRSVISHAHSDHVARHGEVVCTAATADLIAARSGRFKLPPRTLAFGEPWSVNAETSLTLWPAGHVLGSAQVLLTHARYGRLLYSGDFKLRPSASAETCATPSADVLIMETTFARSHYVFPPVADTFAAMVSFCRDAIAAAEIPILLGYSLGRSQEILHGLAGSGLPVMLHPAVEKVTKVYERWGQHFPAYTSFAPLLAPGHVIIAPHQALQSAEFAGIVPRRTAVLTGWAMDPQTRYRHGCDAAWPLSDHAGYDDLLRYVAAVNPQRVLTVHGFAEEFALELRRQGLDAWALGRTNQLELTL